MFSLWSLIFKFERVRAHLMICDSAASTSSFRISPNDHGLVPFSGPPQHLPRRRGAARAFRDNRFRRNLDRLPASFAMPGTIWHYPEGWRKGSPSPSSNSMAREPRYSNEIHWRELPTADTQ